jgi:hypothetical protein
MANNATNVNPISFPYNFGPLMPYALPREGLRYVGTDQLYEFGTLCETPDGRRFRYGKAGAACYGSQLAQFYSAAALTYTTVAADRAIGDNYITIANQSFAKDVLRGGYVVIGHQSNLYAQQRLIVGNTYCSSSILTIYLEELLIKAVTTADGVEIIYSPWIDLRTQVGAGPNGYSTNGGVAAAYMATGYYGWFQRRGPCYITCGETGVGGVDGERYLVAGNDGSVRPHTTALSCTLSLQHVGYILDRNSAGNDSAPWIFLTLE